MKKKSYVAPYIKVSITSMRMPMMYAVSGQDTDDSTSVKEFEEFEDFEDILDQWY